MATPLDRGQPPPDGPSPLPLTKTGGCCHRRSAAAVRLIGTCQAQGAPLERRRIGQGSLGERVSPWPTRTQRRPRGAQPAWVDVGKKSRQAHAADSKGTVPPIRRIANSEAKLDAVVAECPQDTLVAADQRRNIGALAIRRASRPAGPSPTCPDRPSTSSRRVSGNCEDRRARRPGHRALCAQHATDAAAGTGRRPRARRSQDNGGPALAGPEEPHGMRQRTALPPARVLPSLRGGMLHARECTPSSEDPGTC